MPHLNVHCVRALPFHYFRGVWEKMQELGPKGASETFSRSSASMAAAFGSAGSSCSHPSLLGGCFRDSFCPGMFASRTNLTCQEMHIFLECSSPAVPCLWGRIIHVLIAVQGRWRWNLFHLIYLKGKENLDFFP